ncbi:MAG: metallophosphoesterase [Planctomycetota bacterium]
MNRGPCRKLAHLCSLALTVVLVGCGTYPKAEGSDGFPAMHPVTGTGTLAPSNATEFSFVAFGDNQGDTNVPTVMSLIFDHMNSNDPKPAFVLSLGDVVYGKDPQKTSATIKASFEGFVSQVEAAGIPVFNAPGNHEMDDKDDIPNAKMHRLYKETIGDLYGAFDYGNARFIGLNTSGIPPANVCKKLNAKGLECSYISDEDLERLERDLKASSGKTHVFVFMHYPIKPRRPCETLNPAIVKRLSAMFRKYRNVAFVLASHEHLYFNPDDPKNVHRIASYRAGQPERFLVSGGAGAGLDTRPCTKKNAFYHYLWIHVDGPTVRVEIRRIDG